MNTSSSSHVPFVPACLSNPPGQYNPDIELLSIGIWIVEMVQPSLWGLSPQKLYTLVDDDYQFLRDEQRQRYANYLPLLSTLWLLPTLRCTPTRRPQRSGLW